MPVLQLKGCHYEPLGDYLKALGIFRLIAEQLDPTARCWWKDGIFHLWLNLDAHYSLDSGACSQLRDQTIESERQSWLEEWFQNHCCLTAIPAVWQTGTGFIYWGNSEGKNPVKNLFNQKVKHPTSQAYKIVIESLIQVLGLNFSADQWFGKTSEIEISLEKLSGADKKAGKGKGGRKKQVDFLLRELRNKLGDENSLRILDALVVLGKKPRNKAVDHSHWFFPFFGESGGGEGRGQFVVSHLNKTIPATLLDNDKLSSNRLRASLWDTIEPQSLGSFSIGIFWPDRKGDPNLEQNVETKERGNPWDNTFVFEAALLLAGGLSRRMNARQSTPAFPFFTKASLGGHPALTSGDEGNDQSQNAKGELWLPQWQQPATLGDLAALFSEGRIQIADRTAESGTEFLAALSRLGCSRGISTFLRYGLFARSGSGKNTTDIAIYLGQHLPFRDPDASLLAQLHEYTKDAERTISPRQKGVPARLVMKRKELTDAAFVAHRFELNNEAIQQRRSRALTLVEAAGQLDQELALTQGRIYRTESGRNIIASVLPPLSTDWLLIKGEVVDDDTPEFRIGRALGCIRPVYTEGKSIEGLRENILPQTKSHEGWHWDTQSSRYVWQRTGRLLENLASILHRRLIDAESSTREILPVDCHPSLAAKAEDILALWENRCDEARIVSLLRAFSYMETLGFSTSEPKKATPAEGEGKEAPIGDQAGHEGTEGESPVDNKDTSRLPRAYALLKLCFLGGKLPVRPGSSFAVERPYSPGNLRIFNDLLSGDIQSALRIAAERLDSVNYPPILRRFDAPMEYHLESSDCRRLAGLLLIPIQNSFQLAQLTIKSEKQL